MSYGGQGQGPGYGGPPTGPGHAHGSGGRQAALWLVSAGLVVIAAVVVIAVVLAGGSGTPSAGGTTPPPTGSSTPTGSSGPSTGTATGTSGTPSSEGSGYVTGPSTDSLPDNAENALCSKSVAPEYVAVAIVTVTSQVSGGEPDSTGKAILEDCTSSVVRPLLTKLYGIDFGVDYSDDLTGNNNAGPTARYSVENSAGTAKLTLALTKQTDGHYELTDFSYE